MVEITTTYEERKASAEVAALETLQRLHHDMPAERLDELVEEIAGLAAGWDVSGYAYEGGCERAALVAVVAAEMLTIMSERSAPDRPISRLAMLAGRYDGAY